MVPIYSNYFFSCLSALGTFLFCSLGATEKIQREYPSQDRANLVENNPLQDLSKFLFFAICPAKNKPMAEKILSTVGQELKQSGHLQKTKMLIETNEGPAIDLSVFKIGATLIYQIKDLSDLNGKKLGIVRASLNLTTAIEIQKTKMVCYPYIWSSNCFLEGSTEKNLEHIIAQSLKELLEQFMITYSSVNNSPPIFDLQGTD
jgi:hypothetical protein